ncbi:hypothetical protein BJ912DRAFT_1074076 [Pholiota molesta]|nr:hypothetical protein BJ912DRAFT_1095599 [Pholiota molesta]KAF8205103.1 hypothetical protein BJ912DRAFT_1074076 [Pholiota molesta]
MSISTGLNTVGLCRISPSPATFSRGPVHAAIPVLSAPSDNCTVAAGCRSASSRVSFPLCPAVLPAIPPPSLPAFPVPSRLVLHTTFTPQCLAHCSSSQLPLCLLPSVLRLLPLCHVIPSCHPPSARPPAPPSTQLSSHNAWRTLSSPVTTSWPTHSLPQRWRPPTPLFQTTSYHRHPGLAASLWPSLTVARCSLPPAVSYSAWLLAAVAPATTACVAPPANIRTIFLNMRLLPPTSIHPASCECPYGMPVPYSRLFPSNVISTLPLSSLSLRWRRIIFRFAYLAPHTPHGPYRLTDPAIHPDLRAALLAYHLCRRRSGQLLGLGHGSGCESNTLLLALPEPGVLASRPTIPYAGAATTLACTTFDR